MRIDLHTHSDRSDGTDTPTELVFHAVQAGLDVVALTDHDSMLGWSEAADTAQNEGILLVRGVEMSTVFQGVSVHLLGYDFDPEDAPLLGELHRILAGRDGRLPQILRQLQSIGIPITKADVERSSANAVALGRPHVADALVELGVVEDRTEAFDRYLKPGRPGYVNRYAPDLPEAIALLKSAGAITVLAHPWSRGSRRVLNREVFGELKERGLDGLEVDHNDHHREDRVGLRQIARDVGLGVTGSSDYHGTGKTGFTLGCNTTDPSEFRRLFAGR